MTATESNDVSRLNAHYVEFLKLVKMAQHHLVSGRLEAAAVYAQIAGCYAWFNHTGLFSSPELEGILGKLGGHLTPINNSRPRPSQPQEVLHVVTQVYQTGGSTQAIVCWIDQDYSRHHRVCITRQASSGLPEKILTRLNLPSDLLRLDIMRGGLLKRAAALREVASEADVILLHSHPYDIIPIIAFAGASGFPPIIYVNHCDHVFWLGASVANVVLNMRDSGQNLSIARRGIAPDRSVVMERPLSLIERNLTRNEAKRQLGVSPEQVLVVTAAAATKYHAVTPPSFLDMVVPVFERNENALLLAAGPASQGEWAAAEKRTGGRVKALGRLPDITLLHQAADIYIDSFPFASLTSLIEAGSYGTPVITYRGHPEECAVLGADTHCLDEYMRCPTDKEGLQRELSRMITDMEWRCGLGEKIKQAILETHKGDGWRAKVFKIYDIAARLDSPITLGVTKREMSSLDVLVDHIMKETGYCQGVSGAIRDNLGLLPVVQRAAAWMRLARDGAAPSARHLLPEWLLPPLARCWRFVRQC